jgi:hypothetical protein
MRGISKLLAAVMICTLTADAAKAAAPDSGPDTPVVLDKWARYHTNITIYENPGKKPDGSTDYNNFAWVPKVDVVVQLAQPIRDDVVIMQHYQGDKAWGDPVKIPAQNIVPRRGRDYSLVTVSGMLGREHAISDVGQFSVKVSYKQTGMGKLHEDLATFHYTVKNCNRGWTSKGQIKGFYVDHDFRMGEAWLYRLTDNRMELWTWFKYSRDSEAKIRDGRLRLFLGDKMLEFGNMPTRRTEVAYEHYTSQREHDQVKWGLWYWSVPRIEGVMAADYLKNHPGSYRCTLTQDGEIAREFHFTVAADGEFERKPFPGMKTIHSVADSFPLKMEFKDNPDLTFDTAAFSKGKLYSRE